MEKIENRMKADISRKDLGLEDGKRYGMGYI